ncbi:hypothetical protein ACQY0O_008204 [Thecaphora frezii]
MRAPRTYYLVDVPHRDSGSARESPAAATTVATPVSTPRSGRPSSFRTSRSFPFQQFRCPSPYRRSLLAGTPWPRLPRASVLPYCKVLSWQGMSVHSDRRMQPAAALQPINVLPTPTATTPIDAESTPRAPSADRFSAATATAKAGAAVATTDTEISNFSSQSYDTAKSSLASSKLNGLRGSDIRTAPRIHVSTPKHRRLRSDASSMRNPAQESDPIDDSSSIASIASELEELCSNLPVRQLPPSFKSQLGSTATVTATASAAPKKTAPVASARTRPRSNTTSLANMQYSCAPTSTATTAAVDATTTTGSTATATATAVATSSVAVSDRATTRMTVGRRRSQTIGTETARSTRRFRASSLMQSIAEESGLRSPPQIHNGRDRLLSRLSPRFSPGNPCHERWPRHHVGLPLNKPLPSPAFSDSFDYDYIRFIDSDYGNSPSWTNPSLVSTPITSCSHQSLSPIASRQSLPAPGTGTAIACNCDCDVLGPRASQLLAEQDAWLQDELARCSSGEEDDSPDPYLVPPNASLSVKERFSTPMSSPMVTDADNFLGLPGGESSGLLGLGLESKDPVMAHDEAGGRSASTHSAQPRSAPEQRSSDVEQVVGHCASRSESSVAPQPLLSSSMPTRISSLIVPRPTSDSFASTLPESGALYHDSGFSPMSSPMADNGHDSVRRSMGTAALPDLARTPQRRPLSSESSESAQSGSSQASSLLAGDPPRVSGGDATERNPPVDTMASSRPSSIASCHYVKPFQRPPRSPIRSEFAMPPLAPIPAPAPSEAADDVPGAEDHGQLLSPQRSLQARRASVSRRRTPQQPQLPARMTSLDETVAAAPGQLQLREEFPDRLLGDWMIDDDAELGGEGGGDGSGVHITVSPLPFDQMVRSDSQTVSLPGIGEIIPPSPDLAKEIYGLDVDSPALKRLGGGAKSVEQLPMPRSMNRSSVSLVARTPEGVEAGAAPEGSPSRMDTLKARLTGRLGSSIDLIRATASSTELPEASTKAQQGDRRVMVARPTRTINRFIKTGKASKKSHDSLTLDSPRLPAAWEDRIESMKSGDRRPLSRISGSADSTGLEGAVAKYDSPSRAATAEPVTLRESSRRATSHLVDEEPRSARASSSFWRQLSSSANASVASLASNASPTRAVASSESLVSIAMIRQRSVGTADEGSQDRSLGLTRSTSQVVRPRPSGSIEVHRSFFDLSEEDDEDETEKADERVKAEGERDAGYSDDDDDEAVFADPGSRARAARAGGRKDLSKLFGAAESDLVQTFPALRISIPAPTDKESARISKMAVTSRWTSSLGRSSKRRQQQQHQHKHQRAQQA